MTLGIILLAWSLLVVTGWVLLAPLDRTSRDALLPVAPLFGVSLFVVVLHTTTLFVSTSRGVWAVLAVLVMVAAVAHHRDPTWWRPGRQALVVLVLTAFCGILPAIWVLAPAFAVGDSAVTQPNANNDAFYYVTVADWLQDQPATEVPRSASSPEGGGPPPSYSPAEQQLDLNLRLGQELTHAALSTVVGQPVDRTWAPLTALWVLLLPASGVAAARFLRLHLVTGLALGMAISVSALVMFQFASQNSDSLLGSALLPLALGAVLRGVGRHPSVPPVLAGLLLTALLGTYTEFIPLIGPALAVAVLARRPRDASRAVRAAVAIVLVAIALAPFVWLRAAKSLIFLGSVDTDSFPSIFNDAPLLVVVSRFLGVIGPEDRELALVALLVVGGTVLGGVVAALVLSRRRPFYLALVLVGVGLAYYMVEVVQRPYTQQRVVQLLLPLVLLVAAAGWDGLVRIIGIRERSVGGRRRRGRRRRLSAVAVPAAGLLATAIFITANGLSNNRLDLVGGARERHVGPDFAEAAAWIDDLDSSEGAETVVLVGDFFSQLWITDALREQRAVSYPMLHPSYQGRNSYWDGEPRRWLLVDRDALVDTDDDAVVEQNSRFRLLDLRGRRAVALVRADVFGQDSFEIVRAAKGPEEFSLLGLTRPRTPTDPAPLMGYGEAIQSDVLRPGRRLIRVIMEEAGLRVVLSDRDEIFVPQRIRFGVGP